MCGREDGVAAWAQPGVGVRPGRHRVPAEAGPRLPHGQEPGDFPARKEPRPEMVAPLG